MININEIAIIFTSLLLILLVVYIPYKLIIWARQRRAGAYVFGAIVQMVLPDPYVERTIQTVQEKKKSSKKQKENNGEIKRRHIN